MDSSLFWALMFPIISGTPTQYHGAAIKTQDALYQTSAVKQFSGQSNSYFVKNFPSITFMAGAAYQAGYKKQVGFKTRAIPIMPGVALQSQYDMTHKVGSMNFTIPF
jgi:hypothetical protein